MGTAIEPACERSFTFAEDQPFALEAGGRLQPITVHYGAYGHLNSRRDNVILVCHALSGSARVADWWPEMFDAGGAFDLRHHFVLCANVLGSCYGSSGPTTVDPRTSQPYGPDFPLVSIRDIVRTQARLLDHLGISRLRVVLGGSIGGMQALQWAVDYPERVEQCIAIGATPLSAMGLVLNHLQRQVIQLDPAWDGGRYTPENRPTLGLALARAIAMCSYKSAELFTERFGRRPNRNGEDPWRSLADRFDVAGYIDHQGEKFIARFDANCYLMLSHAMDTFDLARGYASEQEALRRITARVSLLGISSDWLFPASDVRALADRMRSAGVRSEYLELRSSHGHDGVLADIHLLAPLLARAFAAPSSHVVQMPVAQAM